MANRSRLLLAFLFLVAATAFADPPGRVGRIGYVQGDVTFRAEDRAESTAAVLNWPVTGGNVVATAPYSRAEVRIGSTAVRLDGATEVEFAALDDERIGLRLVSGNVALRVRNREHAGELEILTPHGRILLADTGRYRFEVDPARGTLRFVVHDGAARFDGPGAAFAAGPGQQAEIRAGQAEDARVTAAFRDEFDDWSLARDRRDDASASARYVSPETTGYDELDAHGDWRESPEYGPVWYPRAVPPGWVPYRDGRWAWIEPWGWTWVDFAPWGFAPFHYGRWAIVGGVWGWVPGRIVPRPVYAPALVAWVGRPGFSVSVSIGSVPAVGWFPLAPREVFYPGYRVSPTYVRNINVTHVTNIARIITVAPHPPAHVRYANRTHALTLVPAQAVSHGQPVRAAAIRVRDQGTLAALPVATSAPAVVRPPVHERRTSEAPRGREAWPQRPAPVAAVPPAPSPRAPSPPENARHEPRNERPDRGAAREAQQRSGAMPEPAARPSPPSIERRESAPPAERQMQRAEPHRMQPDAAVRTETPRPRADRQPVPQPRPESRVMPAEPSGASRSEVAPRAERQQVPRPQADPRPVPQPRIESPRVRAETAQPRAERQPVLEPRIPAPAAPRAERQYVPQPRPEAPPVPQPRAERQPVPEPRVTPQPRREPRVESPRAAAPQLRQESERRGPRAGGR
jgi:hypothetical protein